MDAKTKRDIKDLIGFTLAGVLALALILLAIAIAGFGVGAIVAFAVEGFDFVREVVF